MRISFYKTPIIIFAVAFLSGIIIFLLFPPQSTPYTPLIPIDNAVFEIFIVLLLYPITGLVGAFLIGYILVPLFLFIHTKLLGQKLEYGILETETPQKFKKTLKSIYPILLAVNLALILASNQEFMSFIVYPSHQVPSGEINPIGVVFLLIFTVGIAMGLFSAVWFINDGGIVYSNKKRIEGTDKLLEINPVGKFFNTLLKGYAGISVIITFASYVIFTISSLWCLEDFAVNALIQIGIPVVLVCFNALTMVVLDITKERNKKYVRSIARKLGIVDHLDISITKRTNNDIN